MNDEQLRIATEAAIEAAAEVGLTDRLQELAEIAKAQEAASWNVTQALPYPEGEWPIADVFAEVEIEPGGEKLLYNVQADPDRLRWHHGLMEAGGGALYMVSVPAGVVISPDFARSWLAERTRKSREAINRVENDAREALQQELLRRAASS